MRYNAANVQEVATFTTAVNLRAGKNVDAALAAIVPRQVDTSGAILDIGVSMPRPPRLVFPSSTQLQPRMGRTTGLTCGPVNSISTSVKVQYQQGCNSGKKFWVTYTGQVVVSGSGFSAGGDSGSLMVTGNAAKPVALLFAGSSTWTIGNPITQVPAALGAQLGSNVTLNVVGSGAKCRHVSLHGRRTQAPPARGSDCARTANR